jgi:hypothetical protein
MKNFFVYSLMIMIIIIISIYLEENQRVGMKIIQIIQNIRNKYFDILMKIITTMGFELIIFLLPSKKKK